MRPLYTTALLIGIATPAMGQGDDAKGIQDHLAGLDTLLGKIVGWLAAVLLYDFGTGVPLIVAVLLLGGIYYSFYLGWFSIRAFGHAIDVIRGLYDDPDDPGEISHFKALTSALSATIGLGNIAGVAVAISTGGPGALVWMMLTAIVGMSQLGAWHGGAISAMFGEYSRNCFRGAGDIGGVMVVPVLGVVNHIRTRGATRRLRVRRTLVGASSFMIMGSCLFVTWAWSWSPDLLSDGLLDSIEVFRGWFR